MIRDNPQLDFNDGIALRTYYESLRGYLQGERSSWDPHWQQIAAVFSPRAPKWTYTDVDEGWRRDQLLMNETGILSLRVLQSGMLTNLSSPTSRWIQMVMDDDTLMENEEVKTWLEKVEDKIYNTMLKANVYDTLLESYGEEAEFGTTAFYMCEDDETDIRCQQIPIGAYYISGSDKRRVDFIMRLVSMTVRQVVDQFGYGNCSDSIQTLYDSNAGGVKETWRTVVHVIHKNTYYSQSKAPGEFPWVSVYYELDSYNAKKGVLSRSGYHEQPFVVGRWRTKGENFYGESPCMDILGSTLALQSYEDRIALAVDKQVNPTMLAGPGMDARKLSCLPGDIVFGSGQDGEDAFKPAYKIDFKINDAEQKVAQIQKRIEEGLFKPVFLMFSDSDRREITAEEIRARQQEKLQVLGPVVERNTGDIHEPLVMRILGILLRKGKLPPVPDIVKNKPIKLKFVSILAKAARLTEAAGIDRLLAFCGQEAALQQRTMDIIDWDAATRRMADLADVPAELINTQEEVDAKRKAQDYAASQNQQAENAPKLALAAKNLSDAGTADPSVLTKLMDTQ